MNEAKDVIKKIKSLKEEKKYDFSEPSDMLDFVKTQDKKIAKLFPGDNHSEIYGDEDNDSIITNDQVAFMDNKEKFILLVTAASNNSSIKDFKLMKVTNQKMKDKYFPPMA